MMDKPHSEQLFYLQDTRDYVGNDMLWWRKNNCGYTTNIEDARKWTWRELQERQPTHEKYRAWPVEYIDQRTTLVVDMQHTRYKEASRRDW